MFVVRVESYDGLLLAVKRPLGCSGADDLLKGRIDRLRPSPKGVRQGSIVDASTFL